MRDILNGFPPRWHPSLPLQSPREKTCPAPTSTCWDSADIPSKLVLTRLVTDIFNIAAPDLSFQEGVLLPGQKCHIFMESAGQYSCDRQFPFLHTHTRMPSVPSELKTAGMAPAR